MKEEQALRDIEGILRLSSNAVMLCSFGKDSMVVLDLIRKVNCKIPIVYFQPPLYPKKMSFARQMMEDMELEVYIYPPFAADFNFNKQDSKADVYYYHQMGSGTIFKGLGLINNPSSGVCVKKDLMGIPKCQNYDFKWDVVFSGHKDSDIDPVIGKSKGSSNIRITGNKIVVYPINGWTDEDVWEYIKINNVRYNKERYERGDILYNDDYYECCYSCLNPQEPEVVDCFLMETAKNEGINIDYDLKLNNYRNIVGVNNG